MQTQAVESEATTFKACKLAYIFLLALLLAACSSAPSATPTPPVTPPPPRVEEITFQSGAFTLVGDLVLPEGTGPFPVIISVPGSEPGEREGRWPMSELMWRAGYATFSWDAPGKGESTGVIDQSQVIAQRAQILLDGIEVMKAHPRIDPEWIGLSGSSQGGYVMPRALAQSEDIAFMICVSCPGMAGNDQMAYQIVVMALCNASSGESMSQITPLLSELKAAAAYDTYEEYLHYRQVLDAVAQLAHASTGDRPPMSEETWDENPMIPQTYWNPIEVIEQTDIPILSIFGDLDRNMDPIQAEYAYRKALEQASNPLSRVEVFSGANHGMLVSKTGCMDEWQQILEQYTQSQGYASLSEFEQAIKKDPYRPGWYSDFPFAPGVLDLVEEWLRDLRDSH
jgi:uncharacterized protein